MSKKASKETLGQRLQRLRREASLTQAQVANESGQSLPNLRNWEGDHRTPGLWSALQLARVFGVRLEELAECAAPDPKVDRDRSKRLRQKGGRPKGRPKGSGASGGLDEKADADTGSGTGEKSSGGAARKQGQK
ncbi:MAG: helix-turn-helix domain-containing protein [Planctomycetes bacterium]|nr:helix-turn-helix domain-containing protein [Planctomycetota bacterium]